MIYWQVVNLNKDKTKSYKTKSKAILEAKKLESFEVFEVNTETGQVTTILTSGGN